MLALISNYFLAFRFAELGNEFLQLILVLYYSVCVIDFNKATGLMTTDPDYKPGKGN